MQRTAEPRLVLLDEAPQRETVSPPSGGGQYTDQPVRARVLAALRGDSEAILDALSDLTSDDYRSVSSWDTQELAEMLINDDFLELAYPVYEGLALRHLDRAKARYYPLAERAIESCRWLSRELDDPSLFSATYRLLQREHGQKNPVRRLRHP